MSGNNTTARSRPRDVENATPDGPVICPVCAKVLEGEPNFCVSCGSDLRGIGAHSDTLSGLDKNQTIDGRYRVLEKLGEGGMGAVFKVEHVRMGKIAALKVLRPDVALDKAMKARFLQESRVVAKLSHPNTVQVFDAGELDDGALFMAMEYVPGKDLAWHLKAHGPMSEEKCASIGVQILSSLAEAHEAGIIHRDIKPANVMLVRRRKGGDDQVKLLDFGIAKLAEGEGRHSTTGDFVGTPAYMSPEQVRGDAVDARSDLYALGTLLFELVTGQQLYTGPTAVSIIKQHLETPVPKLAEFAPQVPVSPAFEAVVRTALEKDPARRYPDADAMKKALEALRGAVKVPTRDYTPMPDELAGRMLSREDFDHFERRLRAQRVLWPLAVVAVLVAGSVLAFRGYQSTRATVAASVEREPNNQVPQATLIALGSPVKGAMGAAGEGEGDRDLFVAQLPEAGRFRVSLSGVSDLNLTLEVLQLEKVYDAPPGSTAEKSAPTERLVRRLFLDDQGVGDGERVDGLELAPGSVYLRVEEQAFATESPRPPREKSLVQYTLSLEAIPSDVQGLEAEPNDSPLTAQPLPLTRAVTAWSGARLDDVERFIALRPDAPFSTIDTFKVIEVPLSEQVVVAVVPPDEGALAVIDESLLEAWRLKKAQSSPTRPAPPPPAPRVVKGAPDVIALEPCVDGVRRVRVTPVQGALGAAYRLAAATTGPNGVAGLLDLVRAQPSAAQGALVDAASRLLQKSPELARLQQLRPTP
ncbi:MAG: serine/threonine-protein kinase [Myxococcaceae bacterium]|nr:serine/threonine-protein kinase [Myxococcaceae bacterium]